MPLHRKKENMRKKENTRGTVSVAEFARSLGIGARQVRRHIAAEKIDGGALVRVGKRTRIRPAIARRQLAARLSAQSSGRALTGGARLTRASDALNLTLKSELLRGIRLKVDRLEAQADDRAGRYVRTSEIDSLLKRTVTETFASLEAHMPGFVTALADAFKIPREEVAAMLGEHMKRVRAEATAIREPGTTNGKGH